jgi:CheY-like chemotaxis protein
VVDTGCGISNTVHLFAPFVQANKSIHKKYGGTGLGLNISKQIVALMKGRVGIDSVEGVGTTVWAEIPLRQAPAPRKGPSFTKESPMPTAKTTRTRSDSSRVVVGPNNEDLTKRVRILIVEDNMVNQKLLKKLLQTLGYSDITVTSDGQEAVNTVKESWENYLDDPCSGRYDIVLMDCLMPVMDGWIATKQIRDLEAECLARSASRALQVPIYSEAQPTIILALTANATSEDEQKCNECGMDDYYIKPMPRDGLNAMMLHWVSKLFAETSCEIDEGI